MSLLALEGHEENQQNCLKSGTFQLSCLFQSILASITAERKCVKEILSSSKGRCYCHSECVKSFSISSFIVSIIPASIRTQVQSRLRSSVLQS
jgi:hypothetical protein